MIRFFSVSNASFRSIEPSYKALPTMIDSIPSFSKSAKEIRSAIEITLSESKKQ